MSLACHSWYENLEIDYAGNTVADVWHERECSLVTDASASIDRDTGEVLDYEVSWGADIYCNEHDGNAREKTIDDIISDLDNDSPFWVCQEDHGDWEARVFPSEEAYDEHREEWHGEGEDDEAENAPAIATPTEGGTPGHRAHPRLTPSQRRQIQEFIKRRRDTRDTLYDGLLVPREGTHDTVMHTGRNAEDYIRQYERDWPNHFWIATNDPHITSPSGNSLHTGWS